MPNISVILPMQLQLFNLLGSQAVDSVVDSSRVNKSTWVQKSVEQVAQKTSESPKFWLIEDLWRFLIDKGLSEQWANLVAFAVACLMIVAIVVLVDKVFTRITLSIIHKFAKRRARKIDDRLIKNNFFSRAFHLLPLMIVLFTSKFLFAGFSAWVISAVNRFVWSAIVYVLLIVTYSVLDTMNSSYDERSPIDSRRSIKGYIQVTKIFLGVFAAIFIISLLINKNPLHLLAGLGAAAALLLLIFKDTIMGFVASVQLSAQDMARPGDWISMPQMNADGVVLEINVNSVKVQNWDNTITMIPIYSMVSDGFTNWRGMEDGKGRRFVRTINIDIDSVKILTAEQFMELEKHDVLESLYGRALSLALESSSKHTMTNMALFRAFLEVYLRNHPKINHEMLLFVRYQTLTTADGLPMEIYAFSTEKDALQYDIVHRSVMEYVMAIAPIFDIRLYQRPAGKDFMGKV